MGTEQHTAKEPNQEMKTPLKIQISTGGSFSLNLERHVYCDNLENPVICFPATDIMEALKTPSGKLSNEGRLNYKGVDFVVTEWSPEPPPSESEPPKPKETPLASAAKTTLPLPPSAASALG